MYTKKSLGQHFLKSERALTSIVSAGDIKEGDTILEIGPGTGALTKKLLETSARVISVEKDDNLYKKLTEEFKKEIASGQLVLIHEDILNFDISYYLLPTTYYKLIANIPYNITGKIFEKFLSADRQPERMVLLVQKEVAERVVAKKNKPFDSAQGKESILSISVKAYGKPKYVEKVPRGAFAPAPKVDSAILLIEDISKDFFQSANYQISEKSFFKLVKTGFKAKRKKLSTNLATIYDKDGVEEAFKKLGLDENIRAEDISVEIWCKLAHFL